MTLVSMQQDACKISLPNKKEIDVLLRNAGYIRHLFKDVCSNAYACQVAGNARELRCVCTCQHRPTNRVEIRAITGQLVKDIARRQV